MRMILLLAGLLTLAACETRNPPIDGPGRHEDRPYNDGTPR